MQPVKGMRDILPEEKRVRDWVASRIRQSYELYGFQPWETPALERLDTLARKGAGESLKDEIYCFTDKGGTEVAMRFDLTVPLARVMSQNPQLPKPFKRYEIAKVWRYENPQAGRFREFVQADADIIGSSGMAAEVDCMAAAIAALKNIGFKKFSVRVNNRKILNGYAEKIGVSDTASFFRILDKVEKIGEAAAREELKKAGLSEKQVSSVFSFLKVRGTPQKILGAAMKELQPYPEAVAGVDELETLFSLAKTAGIAKWLTIDLGLVRGLDYYTGTIFEIAAESGRNVGSIAGGGRYDKLIGLYSGRDVPAVGISLGFERICEILKEEKRVSVSSLVSLAPVNDKVRNKVLLLAKKLRDSNIAAATDLNSRDLRKQFEYCNAAQIPFVMVVGEKELKSGKFTLRDMKTGKEVKSSLPALIKKLRPT